MQKQTAFAALLLSLGLLLNGFSAFSQSSSSIQLIYLESNSLNTETYSRLFNDLKSDQSIQLVEACVPAHVFTIRVKDALNQQAAFEAFQNKYGSLIKDVKLLSTYNDDLFMQRCSNARYGRN